jgi:hypothetical protein
LASFRSTVSCPSVTSRRSEREGRGPRPACRSREEAAPFSSSRATAEPLSLAVVPRGR